ncbi:MAG: hypothetical protein ACHQ03_09995 [Candidatus Bathyarchaeia archaeon]
MLQIENHKRRRGKVLMAGLRYLWKYLPSQLATLKQLDADEATAAEIIIQEFKAALHKLGDQ